MKKKKSNTNCTLSQLIGFLQYQKEKVERNENQKCEII
jgi:hypothetical protein